MEKVKVPTAPGRLISAIARIGYDPEVALCDLIDNSIDAGSKSVNITLIPEYREEEGETDTISQYIISDDGSGMNRDTLIGAFTLGSSRHYPPNSLGKFGLGLKSAGLALGDRIVMVSKTSEMTEPICAVLSIRHVQNTGEYEIDLGEVPQKYVEIWEKYAPSLNTGTTLIIETLNENQPSYSKFLSYLQRYCAVIYHMLLEDQGKPLEMRINGQSIEPKDPLFLSEAHNNGSLGDPLQWHGREVKLLLDNRQLMLTPKIGVQIALTHLVHPPTFESEGKRPEIRDHYLIETDPYTRRARHGFYIYRNRRIIVLAERFHGLVSAATQAWAFRGRLMFDESADNILSLDVKKRHCQLPKEARNNLQSIIKAYQHKSIEAWKAAGRNAQEKKGQSKEKYANESITETPVPDLGYAPGTDLSSQSALETRQKLQQEVGEDTLRQITDKNISKEILDQKAEERSVVIPAEGLKGNAMWLPYAAVDLGAAETLINTTHSWISEAYAIAEDEPRITLILHQLFTILARAELEVRSTAWPDLPSNAAERVLQLFRRKASAIGEDLADTLAAQAEKLSESSEDLFE